MAKEVKAWAVFCDGKIPHGNDADYKVRVLSIHPTRHEARKCGANICRVSIRPIQPKRGRAK